MHAMLIKTIHAAVDAWTLDWSFLDYRNFKIIKILFLILENFQETPAECLRNLRSFEEILAKIIRKINQDLQNFIQITFKYLSLFLEIPFDFLQISFKYFVKFSLIWLCVVLGKPRFLYLCELLSQNLRRRTTAQKSEDFFYYIKFLFIVLAFLISFFFIFTTSDSNFYFFRLLRKSLIRYLPSCYH